MRASRKPPGWVYFERGARLPGGKWDVGCGSAPREGGARVGLQFGIGSLLVRNSTFVRTLTEAPLAPLGRAARIALPCGKPLKSEGVARSEAT